MALTYVGDPGRVYFSVSIGGQDQSLVPVPGEAYEMEDPGDGRWATGAQKADTKPVTPDTTKDASEVTPEANEGKSE